VSASDGKRCHDIAKQGVMHDCATGAQTSVQRKSFSVIGQFMAVAPMSTPKKLLPPFLGLSGYEWGGELLKPGSLR